MDGVTDNKISVFLTSTNLNSTRNDFTDELTGSSPPALATPSANPSTAPSVCILGSISRNVKEDIDDDDVGELNLPGTLITLLDSAETTVATTLTDSEGNYLCVDVPIGVYSVRETNFAGFNDVSDVDGENDNVVGVSLTVTNLNSTRNDFVYERVGVSPSSIPYLPSAPSSTLLSSSAPSESLAPTRFCNKRVFVGFETAGDGTIITRGTYVKDEWKVKYGITISGLAGVGGFTPNNMARIFDTSNPTTLSDGDPNLVCFCFDLKRSASRQGLTQTICINTTDALGDAPKQPNDEQSLATFAKNKQPNYFAFMLQQYKT